MAFYQLEPFGDEWLQTGVIASTVNNVHATKRSQLREPKDFMPKFSQPKVAQSNKQIEANLELWKSYVNKKR